jgi:hypothetical protein
MTTSQVDYSSRFYGGFEADERAIWRHLRDQGGYWNASELLVFFPQFEHAQRMGGVLKRLFSGKHLARRMRGQVFTYGVTTVCRAPQGESMQIDQTTGSAA